MPFSTLEHDEHDDQDRDTARGKDKAHIDILLDTPYLTLKGTGPDVEPTRLSGNVVLYLTEATSIKEITLQFRGKARVPVPANESLINNTTALSYVICHHNWSFLEGSNKHARTLKAGRHFFPFHLEVGGSLPSSISTSVMGGASIAYKLRATAVRPRLAHNLQSMITVPLLRSFTHEALEYQQTLEIENSWPEKLMYSVVLPHKAWAIGDKVASLVKLSPLSKGVVVETILMNILETTKIYARSGSQEFTRVIASARHDFIEGRPVLIEENKPWLIIGQASPLINRRTPPTSSSSSTSSTSTPNTSTPALSSHSTGPSTQERPSIPPLTTDATHDDDNDEHIPSSDIVTALFLSLPAQLPDSQFPIVPSHALEPIIVAHRVRWSIFIRNPDSHISELRCSLPIVVLDYKLLNEVRAATKVTRRAVLAPGLETAGLDTRDPLVVMGGDQEAGDLALEDDRELPTYNAHVRDRVANMYLPEAATMRITNPWVVQGTSPVSPTAFLDQATATSSFIAPGGEETHVPPIFNTQNAAQLAHTREPSGSGTPYAGPSHRSNLSNVNTPPTGPSSPAPALSTRSRSQNAFASTSRSGHTSPVGVDAAHHIMAHLPHAPGSGESTPLDWINCELAMSLSEDVRGRFGKLETHWHPGPDGTGSRGPSRPGSPEFTRRSSGTFSRTLSRNGGSAASRSRSPAERGAEHGSGSGHGRGIGGFLKGAMKGFAFTRHHSQQNHHSWNASGSGSPGQQQHAHTAPQSPRRPPLSSLPSTASTSTAASGASSTNSRPALATSRSGPVNPMSGTTSSSNLFALTPDPTTSSPSSPLASTSMSALPLPAFPPFVSRPDSRPSSPSIRSPIMGPSSSSTSSPHSNASSLPRTPSSVPHCLPRTGSHAALPRTASSSSNDAMLHRAFTEVPDYSIAAKGFIGGVPPLSAMQGLPSYEESVRSSTAASRSGSPSGNSGYSSPSRGAMFAQGSSGLGIQRSGTPDGMRSSGLGSMRGTGAGEGQDRSASDGDLVRRFQGMGLTASSSNGSGSGAATASKVASSIIPVSAGASGSGGMCGESSEDDHEGAVGIEMRTRRRTTVTSRDYGRTRGVPPPVEEGGPSS